MARILVLVALPLVLLLGAGEARAAGTLVIPLTAPKLDAKLTATLDAAIRAEVKASLPRTKLLPPPALDYPAMQLAAGCVDDTAACLASIGGTLGATRVVRVRATGSARALEVHIVVVRSRSGASEVRDAVLEGVDADSAPELRWHVARALGRTPPPLTGAIELYTAGRVGSLVDAELFLDDARAPAGALSAVKPGKHRVELHQTGFEPFIWLGEVRPGRTTRVAVTFTPKQPEPKAETPPIAAGPTEPAPAAPPPAAPAPTAATTPPDDGGPRLVATWILGAGALVAAGTATILAVQTEDLNQQVVDERLACYDDTAPDWDSDTCRKGRSRQTMQFVAWGVTGAFVVAATAAFFLEGGLGGDDAPAGEAGAVSFGVAPSPDGVSAALGVRF